MGYFIKKEAIKPILDSLKDDGLKIVFTNGCFDILHKGHIDYLKEASKLGDILVIGINTDESIKRIKGDKRPILPLEDRAAILASLYFVDFVVPFEEDTPYELIKYLIPNVLVKGKDYKEEEIVGYDIVTANNGVVKTIELTVGKSTTNIIDKILEKYR